jgi:hypothetical protein
MASWNGSKGKACERFMSTRAQLYIPIIIIICGGSSPPLSDMVVQAL